MKFNKNLNEKMKHLSGHFDISTSGLKMEAKSYQSILNALNKSGDNVLFLTDMVNGNFFHYFVILLDLFFLLNLKFRIQCC